MAADYIPAGHTLNGDFDQGSRSGRLIRDLWRQCIDSSDERNEARAAAECFAISRNSFNPNTPLEIGIEAAGTHFYNHWLRDTKRSVRSSETDTMIPFDILDFSVQGCPDGKDVAAYFGFSVSAALDYFQPANLFVRWSLPKQAAFKCFSSGTDYVMGTVRFLHVQQQLQSVVRATSILVPELQLLELSMNSPESDVLTMHHMLTSLQDAWTDDGISRVEHPISHVVLDCLTKWLYGRPYHFDENPGFKGNIDKLVLAVRHDFHTIYSLAVLALTAPLTEKAPCGFLWAVYTNPTFTKRGYADDALHLVSTFLKANVLTARLSLHACLIRLAKNQFFRGLLIKHGWQVDTHLDTFIVSFPSSTNPSQPFHPTFSASSAAPSSAAPSSAAPSSAAPSSAQLSSVEQWVIGARCEARYLAQKVGEARSRWYPGTITWVSDSALSCDVTYDDGDVEAAVPYQFIRRPLVKSKPQVTSDLAATAVSFKELELVQSALWESYITAPSLVFSVCVTERGRFDNSGNWKTSNVGNVFGFGIARRISHSILTDVVLSSPSSVSVFREVQLRAMRAPPTNASDDWKTAATLEMDRASTFLLRDERAMSTRYAAALHNLMDSIGSNDQWKQAAAYVAKTYGNQGVMNTLVPNFWTLDPGHRDYPGKRERRKKRGGM